MRTFYWIKCKNCDKSQMLITDLNKYSAGYSIEREKVKADFILNHVIECGMEAKRKKSLNEAVI